MDRAGEGTVNEPAVPRDETEGEDERPGVVAVAVGAVAIAAAAAVAATADTSEEGAPVGRDLTGRAESGDITVDLFVDWEFWDRGGDATGDSNCSKGLWRSTLEATTLLVLSLGAAGVALPLAASPFGFGGLLVDMTENSSSSLIDAG